MFNYVDVLIFLIFLYLVWQGWRVGFVAGLLNVFSTVASFILAVLFYPKVASFLTANFNLSQNVASVVGFLGALIILEIILNLILSLLYSQIAPFYKRNKLLVLLDKYLGVIPSVLVGLFLVTVFMLLILVLPVKSWLREPIEGSWWGKKVVSKGLVYQPSLEAFLTRVPYKNLVYILTPASATDEGSQNLNLPKNLVLTVDESSEKEMFSLVNQERSSRGLGILGWSRQLRDVGRLHCEDMFKRNYFSHYTPGGKSPFNRMDEAGIVYTYAGENLAYAPSVSIAHQGLMNSPGHRENILRPEFGHIGIGVINAGLYGEMFCQEFTN